MIDISSEISFKTARSSGSGGQNVNKVESMVEGYFNINRSKLLTAEEKQRLYNNLPNKITKSGDILVKCQEDRSQLSNKEKVIYKINILIRNGLKVAKKRKATKPSVFSKENRIQAKKMQSEKKGLRLRMKPGGIE